MPAMLIFGAPYPGAPDAEGRATPQGDAIYVQESPDDVRRELQSGGWPQFNMFVRKDMPDAGTTQVYVNAAHVRMVREKP